ncbi:hypothetical protein Tco_0564970 [Tanacetum coccineum]
MFPKKKGSERNSETKGIVGAILNGSSGKRLEREDMARSPRRVKGQSPQWTKGTFRTDVQSKIELEEGGAVQENLEGAWGHALPTQEEKRSHPSPKHQRRSWKWKVTEIYVREIKGTEANDERMKRSDRWLRYDGSMLVRGKLLEIMYEHCFKSFGANTKSRLRKSRASLVGFSGEIYHLLGLIGPQSKPLEDESGRNNILIAVCHSKMRSPTMFILEGGMRSIRSDRITL